MKLFYLLPVVTALNVLLTSTDSWVSKNPRYLHAALTAAGHNVMYVGPLNAAEPAADLAGEEPALAKRLDDGDFGHLMASHQNYYKYMRKVRRLARGAKSVVSKKDSQTFDAQFDAAAAQLVRTPSHGQDPLNPAFWYVNALPWALLAFAFSHVLPRTRFQPDVVIVGPNEGLHLSLPRTEQAGIAGEDLLAKHNVAEAMLALAQVHNLPVIAVLVEDDMHVYYEDEHYFNVEEKAYDKMFRANVVAKNVRFVNARIVRLVQRVVPRMAPRMALNVNVPSLNQQASTCFTNGDAGPDFVQVVLPNPHSLGLVLTVPQYDVVDDEIVEAGRTMLKVADSLGVEEISLVEWARMLLLVSAPVMQVILSDADVNNVLCNRAEFDALQLCDIAVSVGVLGTGNNLGTDVFDLAKYT